METLGRNMLAAMELCPARPLGAALTMERVAVRLGLYRPTQIRIDEFQRSLQPKFVKALDMPLERLRIWGHVRSHLDDALWPTPMILTGTKEILAGLEEPGMGFLREKADVLEIPAMSQANPNDHADLADALEVFANVASISLCPAIRDDLYARLMHASNYAKALAFELCQAAILDALERAQPTVSSENFATIYSRKTGAYGPANPFLAEHWHRVNPAHLLRDRIDPLPTGAVAGRAR